MFLRPKRDEAPDRNVEETDGAFSALRQTLSTKKLDLADFEFGATVGSGTFGRVRVAFYNGSKESNPVPVALKIMRKSEIIRLKQVDHIKSEKNILMTVEHKFVVNLLATFQDDRRLCMVMEYVCGGELFRFLQQEGRLSNENARFFSAEITVVFEYLHSQMVVYRDLKPENVLIDADGHTKVADFGFAKLVEGRTWTLCGTPDYLAPEIIQSRGHAHGVDWWALGILIFEMLSGYPPFFDDSCFGVYQRILVGKVAFPRHVDTKAKDLIKKLLVSDKTQRLGCLKAGAEDVKKHRWFQAVNWTTVPLGELDPPFIPSVEPWATSMFDKYLPESTESSAPLVRDAEQALFESF